MPLRYACERQVIELALESLKGDGLVARDARFNYDAPQQLRREVTYRDFDFLSRLSRVGEVEIVGSALTWLKGQGLAPEDATYDQKAFDALRQEVKERFAIPGTSLTPVMERLLYSWGRSNSRGGLSAWGPTVDMRWYGPLVRAVGQKERTGRRWCMGLTWMRRRQRGRERIWASWRTQSISP